MHLHHVLACMFLSTLVSAILSENPKSICPPDNLINPCTCLKLCEWCDASLLCENIRNQETLSHVLEDSSDYQYNGFFINRSSVMFIPASIFETENIQLLTIGFSTLVSLFDRQPSRENDLHTIVMSEVKLTRGIQWHLFSNFLKLKELRIMHTPILRLDKLFIKNAPKSIEFLYLYNCSFNKLDDHVFSELKNVIEIDIRKCDLKEIKRSMFPLPTELNLINFSHNKIQSLPEDIFSDMPKLTSVFLEDNLISEIEETVFGHIFTRLEVFTLYDNPIKCKCSIRWITTVDKSNLVSEIGRCTSPKELEGRKLRDLRTTDFEHCR